MQAQMACRIAGLNENSYRGIGGVTHQPTTDVRDITSHHGHLDIIYIERTQQLENSRPCIEYGLRMRQTGKADFNVQRHLSVRQQASS
jgi:hypothetical protein